MLAIGIIIQIFKHGIEIEFYRESEKVKGSQYDSSWIDMYGKIKENLK